MTDKLTKSELEELERIRKLRLDILREVRELDAAAEDVLAFLRMVWWMPVPLIVGRHTKALCDWLTGAVERFKKGESSFGLFEICFRHGKSVISSQAFPAFCLGALYQTEPAIILTGYGSDLVEEFSGSVQDIIRSDPYKRIFPMVDVYGTRAAASKWQAQYGGKKSTGFFNAAGLGGALTGKGYHVGVCDDAVKNREEAESPTIRESKWDSFSNDFLTRRNSVAITVVCATPWHIDDVLARIKNKMKEDSAFPQFELFRFPAQSPEFVTPDNTSGVLFPEKYDEKWYLSQRSTLGKYGSAGLMDCQPIARGGNMFKVDGVKYEESLDSFPETRFVRAWDLASTAKERIKDDPDFTVGVKMGMTVEAGEKHLWVADVIYGQWDAPERNQKIAAATDRDGPSVHVGIEAMGPYRDAWKTLEAMLRGKAVVDRVSAPVDKVTRAAPMEPMFQAGNVHVLRAGWNDFFYTSMMEFPSGIHDDLVDSMSAGYHMLDTMLNFNIFREFDMGAHVVSVPVEKQALWHYYLSVVWDYPDPLRALLVSHNFDDHWHVHAEYVGESSELTVEDHVESLKDIAADLRYRGVVNPETGSQKQGVPIITQFRKHGLELVPFTRKIGGDGGPDGAIELTREWLKTGKLSIDSSVTSLVDGLRNAVWEDGTSDAWERRTSLPCLLGIADQWRRKPVVPRAKDEEARRQIEAWKEYASKKNKLVKQRDAFNRPKKNRKERLSLA